VEYRSLLCLVTTLVAVFTLVAEPAPAAPAAGGRVFELRTYTASPGKLDALNARFRNHTVALFKKHGMEVVGFWMPVDKEAGAGDTLVYILAHQSRPAAEASWKAFRADPEWVKVKAESEAGGSLTTKIESVFLTATDYSPIK
jgi:NIPSNAP